MNKLEKTGYYLYHYYMLGKPVHFSILLHMIQPNRSNPLAASSSSLESVISAIESPKKLRPSPGRSLMVLFLFYLFSNKA
jgi:hypothetical protein